MYLNNILTLIPLIAFVCYCGLLLVVLRRGPFRRVNQVFALYLLCMMVWSLGSFMARADLMTQNILFWSKVLVVSSMGMPITFYHFVCTFLRIKEHKEWLYLGYMVYAATLAAIMTTRYVVEEASTVEGLYRIKGGPALPLTIAYGFLFLGLAIYSLIQRYRETKDSNYRNRIRYPLIGVGFIILGGFTDFVPSLTPYPIDIVANIINAFLIAYAILRYQLLDITLVIRKGLLYSIPTAIIGASYFLLLSVAMGLFHAFAGPQIFLISLIVAAITAVVVQPLRDKAQSWIDKLFFREKYDSRLMLQRLSQTAASVLDLRRLTSMLLDEVINTMHISKAGILLRGETGEFRLVAQRGLAPIFDLRLRGDHPIVRWLARGERALTKEDVDTLPQFKALWGKEREDLERLGAELFVPLRAKGELVGIFVLGPKLSEEAYSTGDQITLTTLANQTAVALENARLYSVEKRRAKESSTLLDVARAISSTLDLTQVLKLIAQKAAVACDVDRCSILLLDEEGKKLIPLMSQFASGKTDKKLWRIFKDETYAETVDEVPAIKEVIRSRKAAIFTGDSLSLLPPRWIEPFDVKSLLVVPLISKDKVVGMMALDYTDEGKRFSDEQVTLATTIASQAAMAIENARLFSDLKQSLQELKQTRAQLIQADKLSALGQMIAGVAHEINNPLTTIMGYAQLLQGEEVSDQVRRDLERITEAAKRSQRIVQNLLTFARAYEPRKEYIDINQVIEDTLALRAYQLKVDNIEVVTELDENLPWTMADPYRLQQVFLNLINNAQQAMAELGGGRLTVRSELRGGNTIRVAVSDTGPGIPEEIMPKIFDPFFTTKDVGEGTGLGLSVSYGIVSEHGGRIWAESEEGRGATFIVELPVRKEAMPVAEPAVGVEEEKGLEAKRILIVDDEEDIVALLARLLRKDGYQVSIAFSGQEALKKMAKEDYDLIISDVKMPGLDGRKLYEHIKETDPELMKSIVFITGDTANADTRAFLAWKENLHIEKPFDIEEVKKVVREALKSSGE